MDPYNSIDQTVVQGRPPSPANPYAAPQAAVREVADASALVLASRTSRLGAVLLDSLVVLLPLGLVMAPFYRQIVSSGGARPPDAFFIAFGLFGLFALAFTVYQLVLLYRHGQTVGKKMLGIRIVRSDGSRASFGRLLGLRYLVPGVISMLPVLGPIFSLINPLFIFAEDRRCLHDRIADTIVVNA